MKGIILALTCFFLAACSKEELLVGIEHGDVVEVTRIEKEKNRISLVWSKPSEAIGKTDFRKEREMSINDFEMYLNEANELSVGDTFYCSIAWVSTGESVVFLKPLENNESIQTQ